MLLILLLLVLSGGGLALHVVQAQGVPHSPRAPHVAFQLGDVFVSVLNGRINHYDPTGQFIESLDTTTLSQLDAGMCFDTAGNLYTTEFSSGLMSKFNNLGGLINAVWAGGFNSEPESCLMDASGHIYTGEVDGSGGPSLLRKYDLNGTLLDSYAPDLEARGVDWIDLAADQCTMYYTSEGHSIKRYNVCTRTQLRDFADNLPGYGCYGLRLRANGEVLVACAEKGLRLSPSGVILQVYDAQALPKSLPDDVLFALNLDRDGSSFWTTSMATSYVYKIDIETGIALQYFPALPALMTGVGGVAIYGEYTQGQPTPTVTATAPTATRTATPLPTATRTATAPPTVTTHPVATATATPPPVASCVPQTPTRVPTPVFTPAPGCGAPRPGDLRAVITDHPGTSAATFTNVSTSCAYRIGLAVYKKYDGNINHQELYDYRLAVLPPHSTLALTVTTPPCAYQGDAFYGDLIESFANGDRYGARRLDDTDGNGTNYCVPVCPPTPRTQKGPPPVGGPPAP